MVLDRIAHSNNEKRDRRERFIAQHVLKDLLELRDDEDEQEGHDGERENHDDDRVDHRGHDLVFDLLRLFLELGQAGEDEFEHAAQFAGTDHVDVEIVENSGMLRETFGKSAAALYRVG